MQTGKSIILSCAIFVSIAAPAFAQKIQTNCQQMDLTLTNARVILPASVTWVLMQGPVADARDTRDAYRDQYYAEDTFQTMALY